MSKDIVVVVGELGAAGSDVAEAVDHARCVSSSAVRSLGRDGRSGRLRCRVLPHPRAEGRIKSRSDDSPPAPARQAILPRAQKGMLSLGDSSECLLPRLRGGRARGGQLAGPAITPRPTPGANHDREIGSDPGNRVPVVGVAGGQIEDGAPPAALAMAVCGQPCLVGVISARHAPPGSCRPFPEVPPPPLSLINGRGSGLAFHPLGRRRETGERR